MTAKQQQGFEASMDRLDEIVREMEDGELKLDDLISRFEEGRKLLGLCSKKLNEVERKIEMLVSKDGQETTVPFEGEAVESAAAAEIREDELF